MRRKQKSTLQKAILNKIEIRTLNEVSSYASPGKAAFENAATHLDAAATDLKAAARWLDQSRRTEGEPEALREYAEALEGMSLVVNQFFEQFVAVDPRDFDWGW